MQLTPLSTHWAPRKIKKKGSIFFGHSVLCNFSSGMLSTNFLKVLVYLLIRVSLLTGQFSDHSISAFSVFLYCFTSSQTCDIWSVVCSPILQGHIELSIILYLYRYDLILPWSVTIIVRFGVTSILIYLLL